MLDFGAALQRESVRFVSVLAEVPPGARVPTCPDWDVDDLLWHLTEVQWFWGEIVQRRAATAEDAGEHPRRPSDRAGLLTMFGQVSARLQHQLAVAPAHTPVWMWAREHRTVGYIARRQAHEAMIHRVDAELTAGVSRLPLDPALAADGVDEMLRIMASDGPEGAELRPDRPETWWRIVAVGEQGRSWLVQPARLVGGEPDGDPVDEAALLTAPVDDGRPVTATVTGTAADLDALVWNRPPLGEIQRDGDPSALAAFDELLG
jgi:uncharacterized protein (TIGR03083 family)